MNSTCFNSVLRNRLCEDMCSLGTSGAERISNLQKVIQLVISRDGLQTQTGQVTYCAVLPFPLWPMTSAHYGKITETLYKENILKGTDGGRMSFILTRKVQISRNTLYKITVFKKFRWYLLNWTLILILYSTIMLT